jgi:choline dehydrogenase-like flavoprotein
MAETLLEYDIVIVGSGAGGGTVAKELSSLCAQGLKIALLEWGGHFEKKDNTREEVPMAEKYYFDNGGFQTSSQDMTLAFAKAVGGSTTVYTGTSITAPDHVIQKWAVPSLTPEDLQPRFEKYKTENNVHLYPENEINENNKLFVKGCETLGWQCEQFPVNTRECQGLAMCNLGCAVHAKQGTAVVQIPEAQKNGVEVISFCRVDHITDHDVIAEIIPPEHGLQPSSLAPGAYRFRAKKIVLSAGVINTPTLLLRSFGKSLSPALGRYFTCQPALILVAQHPHPIHNTSGHPKSFYCDQFTESDRFLLETCMYFPFTLSKNLMGFGEAMDDLIGHYQNLQMILVLAIDDAEEHNRVTIDKQGKAVVHYKFSQKSIDAFVKAIRASTRIFFAGGAEKVHAPAMDRFLIHQAEENQIDELIHSRHFQLGKVSISAAHLMGGCRMGDNPQTSVTNPWGKVHGQDHLYVADASLFPAAVEVNPYLTIMALADRVAEGIKQEIKKEMS